MIILIKFECSTDPVSTRILKMLSESNPRIESVPQENAFSFEGTTNEVNRILSAIKQSTDIVTTQYVSEKEK